MRYFLEIAYNGLNYHGWQVQPGVITVQEEVNKAMSTLLQEDINVMGCGRTDAQVHARQFFLHFDTKKEKLDQLVFKLNMMLPKDIGVKQMIPVEENAHTRFDAKARTYEYLIYFEKDPFLENFGYYYVHPKPDVGIMNQAAQLLLNYEDFKPLSKTGGGAKTSICKVNVAKWEMDEENQHLLFTVQSDRFLRSMVRFMVGITLMAGRGKLTLDEIKEHMEQVKRFKYIMPVPGFGLYLTRVEYPYIS